MNARKMLVRSATELVDTLEQVGTVNAYHRDNLNASLALIQAGHGDAEYKTQWLSGASSWVLSDGSTVKVDTEGTITRTGQG